MLSVLLTSCYKDSNPYANMSSDYFTRMSEDSLKLDRQGIRATIDSLDKATKILTASDKYVRNYYSEGNPCLWIHGGDVSAAADSVLVMLDNAEEHGFRGSLFRADDIRADIARVRSLSCDGTALSNIFARLEYNLSLSYFRYITSLHYGFVSPNDIFNRIDTVYVDSVKKKMSRLCDMPVLRPDSVFYSKSVQMLSPDSIVGYVAGLSPQQPLYTLLKQRLANEELTPQQRKRVLCNMERCRWRLSTHIDDCKKYIEVNIPSFGLRAVDADSVLTMRIGCGTVKQKTPLLSSKIKRMELNPQWIVPKSIAKGIAYSYSYMHRNNMFIHDKKLGKLPPEQSSLEKILNGEQYIVQESGPKNSLGRIIFRFENSFSVFLHDTSSPWIFQYKNRAVSHGCVRVQKPYDLAVFLLEKKDQELMDKIKYSMTVQLDKTAKDYKPIDKSKMKKAVYLDKEIPLFISYYTVYYASNDDYIVEYEDIYGYDKHLAGKLAPYVK